MSIQNEILNAIASRRSCRAYKPEQITAEELEAVTTAGTWAATAMGRQSPVMVAVQDKETLAELSRLNAAVMGTQNDPFYGAPTAVLVLGEKNNPNGVQDASLVMGNLLLAASGIGLGSCWINRAKETFETPEGKALLAKWGLDPEKYIGVGYCILGYPAPNGTRTPGPRKAGYAARMIFGVGIDLCDAGRLEKSLAKQSFLDHVFAPSEQALLASLGEKRRAETAAANFAAKEAFLKAAGTGLGGFAMPELAVLRQKSGAPYFALTGAAAVWVREQGLTVHVSLTHERGLANALVLLEKE